MDEFNFLIFNENDLIAGFVSLCTAVTFAEEWYTSLRNINLVEAHTGEVIDIWCNGTWRNGKF